MQKIESSLVLKLFYYIQKKKKKNPDKVSQTLLQLFYSKIPTEKKA